MNSWARTLAGGFVDVIFPPSCVHCRGLVDDETLSEATSERMDDAASKQLPSALRVRAEPMSVERELTKSDRTRTGSGTSECVAREPMTSEGTVPDGTAGERSTNDEMIEEAVAGDADPVSQRGARPERSRECGAATHLHAHRFRHLCRRCVSQLEFVGPPHCTTCGHPFYGLASGERRCVKCEGLEPVFGEGRTAVLFKGPARTLVIELKYHRALHVLTDMAEIFRRSVHVLELVRGAVLVPVPLHARKARERGYNQAALLAGALARAAGSETQVLSVLRRVADTATQTAFDRRTRLANLKNAFALTQGAALNPALHYILVDDVFTTGSTLNSCARALREAGALKVDVVTFGHG